MAMNLHDNLLDRCRKWSLYPQNLLRPCQLKHVLKDHLCYLDKNEDLLFDADEEKLDFLEAYDGDDKYYESSIESCPELQQHIHDNRNDPKSRHIFVQAEDSRSPLNCSRESLTYILAFHQVAPFFLNYLTSFGDTDLPKDYSMTGFQSEDSLGIPKNEALEFKKLGRSGYEIRNSYILRSVERDRDDGFVTGTEQRWPWKIRQMAVYHSYDVVNGRAFWLTVKANDLMKNRITEASSELPEFRATSLEENAAGFSATLITHLIYLDWCDENWRQCINDIEGEIRKILTKAKTLRIDHEPTFSAIPDVIKQEITRRTTATQQSIMEPKPFLRSGTAVDSIRSGAGSMMSGLRRAFTKTASANKSGIFTDKTTASAQNEKSDFLSSLKQFTNMVPNGILSDRESAQEQLDSLLVLDMFSFNELQSLHDIGERLEEMRLVIKLDTEVLQDIRKHYNFLMERADTPKEIRQKCAYKVAEFSRRVERIERNLEIRRTQVESMQSWLKDGKTLFDGILQYRSVQVTRIFAEVAHKQANRMEKITHKAEQETISMHIITFVALVFLPGTFVAVRLGYLFFRDFTSPALTSEQTFFQTGLLSWQPNSNKPGNTMQFNWDGFTLFSEICFPLMAITFLAWWLLFKWMAGRSRRVVEQGEV